MTSTEVISKIESDTDDVYQVVLSASVGGVMVTECGEVNKQTIAEGLPENMRTGKIRKAVINSAVVDMRLRAYERILKKIEFLKEQP